MLKSGEMDYVQLDIECHSKLSDFIIGNFFKIQKARIKIFYYLKVMLG